MHVCTCVYIYTCIRTHVTLHTYRSTPADEVVQQRITAYLRAKVNILKSQIAAKIYNLN